MDSPSSITEDETDLADIQPGLLQMPWLIIDHIITRLNLESLLTLRLTCKTIKSWIESPKHLKTLRVHIKSKSTLTLLIERSQTSWNNFYFEWIPKKHKLINQFIYKFSEDMHSLEFSSKASKYGDSPGIIEILLACDSLKILIIHKLDCSVVSKMPPGVGYGLAKSLENLEQLGIFELLCFDEYDANLFAKYILSKCFRSLKTLAVPVITYQKSSPFQLKYEKNKALPTDVFVMRPIIQLLEMEQTRNLETIVVVPETRNLLSDSALFCLCLLLYTKKINLYYDSMTSFPLNLGRLNYAISAHPTMAEIASKIMTVMASTTDLLLDYEFGNLRKLIVQFKSFHINYDMFTIQKLLRLQMLIIDFKIPEINRYTLRRMNMFIKCILDVERPSVTHLMVENHDQVDLRIKIKAVRLVNAFVNLKHLAMRHWDGQDDEFPVLWNGLKFLETVELRNCRNLSDKGILGDNWAKPAILNLKYLQDIVLYKTGRITDLSYVLAFRHLRLRTFHHLPLSPSDVTWTGYSSLVEGDFRLFIKFLNCTTNYFGCSKRSELAEYLDKFEHLIDPDKEKMLTKFTRYRRYHRLVKGFSKD